ncbi:MULTISPECIES: 4-hydroxyphenylacetate decarboxylase small subunit [Clostridium]|uniref:4-hydroxyphenylacetate decarboxylase small subunit n=3 Tax=Clostridium TaxID=1485 RepID=A0AAV3W5R7_9CLOT|nr:MULTISPECIES: 4-hydroxyphenylacetate decarboxylase small subunit [Clostridium]NRY63225.1 4-hydroxyphenylacetate decarboxylase small subunit [Clostridium beijerinckii]OOM58698.1 4-hydroxyphenylacetate decarboxylase small subunit [Clostridium beijerinckii]QES73417.1 4-hydroxyphenylacetate decarboxylase small subunit [Clostridium diolis]GEA33677.1 4-hydroxyphenylacetate decarboxylase small subunit [Clostridium diolis]
MRHYDCKNYINLDCEKGMCALCKAIVPIDGENSNACPKFKPADKCSNCKNFSKPDKYGIGICTGLEKENWTYSSMNACTCSGYEAR